jgi:hypothetical protein
MPLYAEHCAGGDVKESLESYAPIIIADLRTSKQETHRAVAAVPIVGTSGMIENELVFSTHWN